MSEVQAGIHGRDAPPGSRPSSDEEWVARWFQRRSLEESVHASLIEAVRFLGSGEDRAELSAEAVVAPNGDVVLTGEELDNAVTASIDGRLSKWLAAERPDLLAEQG